MDVTINTRQLEDEFFADDGHLCAAEESE